MFRGNQFLGGRFGYFLFFLFRAGGKGGGVRGGGWRADFNKEMEGGGSEKEAREGEGRRGNVCREEGGGLNIFFRGRNAHQDFVLL